MMSRGLTVLGIVGLLSLILAACAVDEGVQSLNGEHNVISVENVVGVQLTSVQDVNVRQVVGAAASIQVFTANDEQDGLAVGQTLDECLGRLGRWGLASYQFFDYVNALVESTVRQRTEECRLDQLLRGALCVVAWLRAVYSAATGVMRCADGALACAASTLLTERLTATAANLITPVAALYT